MRISVFGTGYVGLVTGATLASVGHKVDCIDVSKEKISALCQGQVPFFEPGLSELIQDGRATGALSFKLASEVSSLTHEAHYLAVGTPEMADGSADLSYIFTAVDQIIQCSQPGSVVVVKSTVPIGTNRLINDYIEGKGLSIVSNPEFLREGSAVRDSLFPDRIILGAESPEALQTVNAIYRSFQSKCPILEMGWEDAELTKYAANAFLAAKISFMNEISRICEAAGADIHNVKAGMVLDPRINDSFMNAGCGYGGSCFPKDVLALEHTARDLRVPNLMLRAIDETNDIQKEYLVRRFLNQFSVIDKRITVLGLAFKPDTDDVREAPSLEIVPLLLKAGARVTVYDPEASDNFCRVLRERWGMEVRVSPTAEHALVDANVVVMCTEWDELVNLEADVCQLPTLEVVLDGRNVWKKSVFERHGRVYLGVGS